MGHPYPRLGKVPHTTSTTTHTREATVPHTQPPTPPHPTGDTPMLSAHLPLPWATPPALTLNDALRSRAPQAQARLVREAKKAARWAIRAANLPAFEQAHVQLHLRLSNRHLRDADNLAGVLKVVNDALVLEHVLPADDWRHVPHVGITIHPPAEELPGAMWATLEGTPRQEGAQ